MSKFGFITIIGLMIIAAIVAVPSEVTLAAPDTQLDATLTFAGECDYSASPTVACLAAPRSRDPRITAFQGTPGIVGIFRFNIATGTPGWAIDKARFSLALANAGTCGAAASVPVMVYGTANGESNPPQRGALLATVDGGTTAVPFPGTHSVSPAYNHWTDTTFADGLVQYVEAQRGIDGVVTLWVEQVGYDGTMLVGGATPTAINGVCGSGVGGYLIGAPALQLADEVQPLSVTMAGSPSATSTPTWPLYAGLGTVALVVIAGLAVSRRRTA